jgi:hypothetical protein
MKRISNFFLFLEPKCEYTSGKASLYTGLALVPVYPEHMVEM